METKKNNKKHISFFAASAAAIFLISAILTGCDDDKNKVNGEDTSGQISSVSDTESETDVQTSDETDNTAGESYNYKTVNRLTGMPLSSEDLHDQRPIAVMINNIHIACPQVGIRNADIMYECTVEGGITRLMMLTTDYKTLGTIGSIRSCREYYLDMAANHDAIYVHIGGSNSGYENIRNRNVDDIDGLTSNMYFRDQDRLKNMGYEHSAMSNGELISKAIDAKNYRTEYKDGDNTSFKFIPYNEEQNSTYNGSTATNIKIPYTSVHQPRFEYNESTGKYDRFQFIDEKHIDGETGEQLAFDNVLIIQCKHSARNDEKNRINVFMTGTGKGYYASQGKYIPITWEKTDVDSPMKLKTSDGNELMLNCGKTFVNIVSEVTFPAITME